jgi:SAM-dependent methyltransferase
MDARLHSPSVARNRDPILAALRPALPRTGLLLEVASGGGEHAAHLAAALPSLQFQPTDPRPEALASIDAWCAGLSNAHPALRLDATWPVWPVTAADAVLCINMVHIAPWAAAQGLVSGAGRLLPPGGLLALYGPFVQGGQPLAPGNVAFDADLRARDPAWGLRAVDDLAALAATAGFSLPDIFPMPANNLLILFRRGQG